MPIAVDIARIIQKLDVVDTKEIQRSNVWNDTSSEAKPLKIMAIKSSAKKVFWQLSDARNSLYESVYHHHKVLTAETMFRDALHHLYGHKEKISFCEIMLLTDDAFNEYWKYVPANCEHIETNDIQEIDNILKRIRERALYKRVAMFSVSNLKGNLSDIVCFFRNVIQSPSSQDCSLFKNELTEEYQKINQILNSHYTIPDQAPVFMFISAKYDSLPSMPFESGDGYCTWSSSLMKHDTIEAGKKSRQEQFYLISDCYDRDIVYLALEKILAKRGITFGSNDSIICLKTAKEDINSKRIALLENDYYKDTLYLLQDDIFLTLLNERKMNNIVTKYQSFLGVNSCKITMVNLIKFLRQFLWLKLYYNELVIFMEGILELLETAYYIDRDTFLSQIEGLLDKLNKTSFDKKHIASLGNTFDSSKHLMYYFNDIKDKKDLIFDASLETALEKLESNECLCFFDDGAYSGKQVISIFQELMGVPEQDRTTNEHHVDELSDENKTRLQQANIILSYLCFNSDSKEYIISELKNLGLQNVEIFFVENLNESVFKKVSFSNDEQIRLLNNCLTDIGKNIMKSRTFINGEYKSRWDEERTEKAALGYNDAQQMVIFSTSVPTYTITAFWQNGKYKGNEWKGLFQRTVKD